MKPFRDPGFNPCLDALPAKIQIQAKRQFKLLQSNPRHPSLHFKRLHGTLWSVRAGRSYRALAKEVDGDFQWFWIGPHKAYDKMI